MKVFSLASALTALLAAVSSATLATNNDDCVLSGTYENGTDISACSTLVIDSLTVPAGVMLDLTKAKTGATIKFEGNSTFEPKLWEGPLIKLTGKNLTVTGSGTLDGQGSWYWPKGQSVTRPVFFRLNKVISSTLSDITITNSPYRTFSILSSKDTTVSGLTLDSSAGKGLAKNTDGFDLGRNDHVTITNCRVYNQDDCLAMQSSNNTVFSNNYCNGGHGISIGSLGGTVADESDILNGLKVINNTIVDNDNGIRIKTIIGLVGLVANVEYIDNTIENCKNGIVVHSDYNKTKGGYSGTPTSMVPITNITIDGLSGSAKNIYDIKANPDVVSNWEFKNLDVTGGAGSCSGQPSNIVC